MISIDTNSAQAPSIYSDGTYLVHVGESWHQEDSPWKAERIQAMLNRNGLVPETICDVGCGAGEILNQLSQTLPEKTQLFGYEVSPQAYALCEAKASARLSFRLANLLDEDSEPYDLVMAIDVFEHVDDYLGFLRRLKPKGRFKLFHIPLDLSVQSILRVSPILKLRRQVGHLHYFTKETALESLKHAGYEVVDAFFTATAVDLPNRGWKANLMKLPRRALHALSPDWAVRIFGGYSLMVLAR